MNMIVSRQFRRWMTASAARRTPIKGEIEDIMIQRGFAMPSFEIYGGVSGLYDLGPHGSQLMNNIIRKWRQKCQFPDEISEIGACSVTPEKAFKASGHTEKFTDLMVADVRSGEYFRADKLIESDLSRRIEQCSDLKVKEDMQLTVAKAAEMSALSTDETITNFGIKSPSGGELGACFPFNLMFETSIGPSGKSKGFLRPETAQGMFTNFRRLLELNSGKLPFGISQIGSVFRNEISPRSGLLRMREFSLAEIEYFYDPLQTVGSDVMEFLESHREVEVSLYGISGDGLGTTENDVKSEKTDRQSPTVKLSIGQLLSEQTIKNPLLLHFMVRSWLYLGSLGIDVSRARFRKHQPLELAHYAHECWDIELLTSRGWIESIGVADRTCYDLEAHSKVSGVDLSARRELDPPVQCTGVKVVPDKAVLGRTFREKAPLIMEQLESKKELYAEEMKRNGFVEVLLGEKEKDTERVVVSKEMVSFESVNELKSWEAYYPAVIEPSFGLHRILYALMEHSYHCSDTHKNFKDSGTEIHSKKVLQFLPEMAPVQVIVLALSNKPELVEKAGKVYQTLRTRMGMDVVVKKDFSSASIGKRYARADEIGVPYAVTVDFESLQDEMVTVRERDSGEQRRMYEKDLGSYIRKMVDTDTNTNT